MIVAIKDGSLQTILVNSKITFDPSVLTPNGPFNVLSVNEQDKTFTCDGEGLDGTALTADGLSDVDNVAIPQQIVKFGNGVDQLMFADAAQLVQDLLTTEAALMQQVRDLQSGAAIKPLMDQIAALTAANGKLKDEIVLLTQTFPQGYADKLKAVENILFPPQP